MPSLRKASPLAAPTPACSAVSGGRSEGTRRRACASSAGCSSRCTGAAASATTCSPSALPGSSASTPASPRSTICSTRAAARRAASAAPRSCAARASARTAAARSIPEAGRGDERLRGDRHRAGTRGLMATGADERERAIAAADTTCPRCGAPREPEPALLPRVRPRAAERRGQGARAAPTLAAALRVVPGRLGLDLAPDAARRRRRRGRRDRADRRAARVARGDVRRLRRRSASPSRPPCRRRRPRRRSTPPRCPPRPSRRRLEGAAGRARRTAASSGRATRTAGRSCSSRTRRRTAARAPSRPPTAPPPHGLHQVGILDSSRYASLQPGYLVVFTGIYGSRSDADASVSTARQAGFARGVFAPDRPLMCSPATQWVQQSRRIGVCLQN